MRIQSNVLLVREEPDTFTAAQQRFIDRLIKSFHAKTMSSQAKISKSQKKDAFWLNTLFYRSSLKELQHPVVVATSKGSRIVDIDGNQYVDIAMGYGVNFFGHNPDFIKSAILEQLDKSTSVGFEYNLMNELSQLLSDLTSVQRSSFGNTGTEVVMDAVRIARGVTGRSKIVIFQHSYHGRYSGVFADLNAQGFSIPISNGVTQSEIDDTIVLEYGTDKALEVIYANRNELAAVLIEPVQSRNPALRPVDFLLNVRKMASEFNFAFIFDEVFTGFRERAGGCQGYFDIQADLVCYGKLLGGGLPIGVLGGNSHFMDAIDGGDWRGRNCLPDKLKAIVTTGTFCKHPLAMVACHHVLKQIHQNGDVFYKSINQLTEDFAKSANELFASLNVPLSIEHFGPHFVIYHHSDQSKSLYTLETTLFFSALLLEGVYTWPFRICCFSTEHSQEDIEFILAKFKTVLNNMLENGFWSH